MVAFPSWILMFSGPSTIDFTTNANPALLSSSLACPLVPCGAPLTSWRRLERVIRELVSSKDHQRVYDILEQLCDDYAYAVNQPYARNGGLIGLAAAAIALGNVCAPYRITIQDAESWVWSRSFPGTCPRLYHLFWLASPIKMPGCATMRVRQCIISPKSRRVRSWSILIVYLISFAR